MSRASPRIAVLAVGDELLSGEVVDTNLRSAADALGDRGFAVARHVTVADDTDAISSEVSELAREYDVIIVTGGLGPTSDDLTTEAIAKAAGTSLVFQPHIEQQLIAFFDSLGRSMPGDNLKQAYLPGGALEIPAQGTAPGFMIEIEGALVAALPGVPSEMEAMLAGAVLPEIDARYPRRTATGLKRLMTFGMGESDVALLLADRIHAGSVKYGFLARSGPIIVKLTAEAEDDRAVWQALLAEEREAEKKLGDLVYSTDDRSLEEVVGEMLRARGMTVSTAESLTAGMVSARLADVPGSSDYLLGGVVAYGAEEKRRLLEVPAELMAGGVVGTGVAEAMARGAMKLFGSDMALATTGIAGPGTGGETKRRGTVALAVVDRERAVSVERRLPGDRAMVRNIATMAALNAARLFLSAEP